MDNPIFRFVKKEDIPAILAIYTPYVQDTAITFECDPPSLAEFTQRVQNISAEYPYIVCETDGKVIGYGYAHRHMERAAYQWNAELSIYIDQNHLRGGIGKKMYQLLMDILVLQNVRNVYGCVTVPNAPSEKLHQHFGFSKVGTYHNSGYKCGKWHDVAWFEKTIGTYDLPPAPFKPIIEVDGENLDSLFAKLNQ